MFAVCLHAIVNSYLKWWNLKRPWPLPDMRHFSHMYWTNKYKTLNGTVLPNWPCLFFTPRLFLYSTHTCINTYINGCMHAYIHTCLHSYMHTHIIINIHAYIRTYIHMVQLNFNLTLVCNKHACFHQFFTELLNISGVINFYLQFWHVCMCIRVYFL